MPFVGFVLFYIAGIIFGDVNGFTGESGSLMLSIVTCILFILISLAYRKRARVSVGLLINLLLFFAGLCQTSFKNERLSHQQNDASSSHDYYELIIRSLPENRAKSLRFVADGQRSHAESGWKDFDASVLFSIPLDASYIPSPGDHILVKGQLCVPVKPPNPDEFDYAEYLWNSGTVATGFAEEGSFVKIESAKKEDAWRYYPIYVSEWADKVFREKVQDDRAYGLLKAVILGRRDDLRTEQIEDFKVAGAIHILSVSGLHVGIIFLILGRLLGWMKKIPYGKISYTSLIAAVLCFYAMVTGLPSSVVRATIMCLIFLISEISGRENKPMNTLAISAFLILLFDPLSLYNIGFQLTYLAMAGIFLFYKPLDRAFVFENWLAKNLWSVTALAFSAQITTFPLMIYAFHQFPTYFWLLNPIVVFCIDMALNFSLALLFLSAIHMDWLSNVASLYAEIFARLTNFFAALTQYLPFNRLDSLAFDQVEVAILYVLMLIGWLAFYRASFQYLKAFVVLNVVFVIYSLSTDIQKYLTDEAFAFSIPRHSVVGFKKGNMLYILADSTFDKNGPDYEFHIKNYTVNAGVLQTKYLGEQSELPFRKLTSGILTVWNDKLIYMGSPIKDLGGLDYTIFSSPVDISQLRSGQANILLGGQIGKRRREEMNSTLTQNRTPHHDLSEGFFRF